MVEVKEKTKNGLCQDSAVLLTEYVTVLTEAGTA